MYEESNSILLMNWREKRIMNKINSYVMKSLHSAFRGFAQFCHMILLQNVLVIYVSPACACVKKDSNVDS